MQSDLHPGLDVHAWGSTGVSPGSSRRKSCQARHKQPTGILFFCHTTEEEFCSSCSVTFSIIWAT